MSIALFVGVVMPPAEHEVLPEGNRRTVAASCPFSVVALKARGSVQVEPGALVQWPAAVLPRPAPDPDPDRPLPLTPDAHVFGRRVVAPRTVAPAGCCAVLQPAARKKTAFVTALARVRV